MIEGEAEEDGDGATGAYAGAADDAGALGEGAVEAGSGDGCE